MLILKVFHIRCTRFCMEIAILAYNDLLEKGVFMSWCIYDWKHVTLCILGPPFGLNHYLFPRFWGGLEDLKKSYGIHEKKLRGLRGKYAEFGRLVGLQWIPWKAVVILSVLWTNLQIIEEPVVDLGWACAVETVIDSLFLAPLTQLIPRGAIETTNGKKGAQVLMPIQSERHLVWTRFLTRSLRFVRQPPSEP